MDPEVKKSYGRCCVKPEFFDTFYDTLIDGTPEIKLMFANTDMERQKRLVKDGISTLMLFSSGSDYAKIRCKKIGVIHDRNHVNVRPELYDLWVSALLLAVKKHDPQYSPALEKLWRETLSEGIEYMKSLY